MKNILGVGLAAVLLLIGGWYFFYPKSASLPEPAVDQLMEGEVIPSAEKEIDIPALTVIVGTLDTPWGIGFLPDGSMLVTERLGRVRLIDNSGRLMVPVAEMKEVMEIGEGGLLGIAIHPQFLDNHFVYLYYTYTGEGDNTFNRVSRMSYIDRQLHDEKVMVDAIPGASNHNGGRIQFGPDGYLYITTGDAQDPSRAQNIDSLAGKILRVTDDGEAAPGNPFGSLIYSYGHRNTQGLAWDKNGELWVTEHGRSNPSGYDEINLVEPGENYGWDIIQGDESEDGMVTPKKNSGADTTWAPAGAAFAGESLFFGGLRGQALYEAVIENGEVKEVRQHLKGQFGRIRDVVLGTDGMLYMTTSNRDGRGKPANGDDRIIRVNPEKL